MEPPADLHGPIFGPNNPVEEATATNYHDPLLPSTVKSNPNSSSAGLSSGPNLPLTISSNPIPSPGVPIQDRPPVYHHHKMPSNTALSPFVPPMWSSGQAMGSTGPPRGGTIPPTGSTVPPTGNTVPPTGSTVPPRGGTILPVGSTVKAPPVRNKGPAPLKTQQTNAKKRKPLNTKNKPNIRKGTKTSEARSAHVRPIQQHDENDVRYQVPQNWDEVMAIQQVLESVVRSFGRITGHTPPIVSPWCSYQHQRAAFQEAADYYWQAEGRQGPSPELAGLGPWNGPVKLIVSAPVAITEEELETATHPSVAAYQPLPGSIAWLELHENFDNMLNDQLEPNFHAQPPRRHQRVRTSPSQSQSFEVNCQATREQGNMPYQLGGLIASRIQGTVPGDDSHSIKPVKLPYQP